MTTRWFWCFHLLQSISDTKCVRCTVHAHVNAFGIFSLCLFFLCLYYSFSVSFHRLCVIKCREKWLFHIWFQWKSYVCAKGIPKRTFKFSFYNKIKYKSQNLIKTANSHTPKHPNNQWLWLGNNDRIVRISFFVDAFINKSTNYGV